MRKLTTLIAAALAAILLALPAAGESQMEEGFRCLLVSEDRTTDREGYIDFSSHQCIPAVWPDTCYDRPIQLADDRGRMGPPYAGGHVDVPQCPEEEDAPKPVVLPLELPRTL